MSVIAFFTVHVVTVIMHEPVYFDLEIHNKLMEPVCVDLGHNRKSALAFTVVTPDGSIIRVPPLISEGLGLVGRVTVKPGDRYKQTYLLNEWYTFPAVGNYSIQAEINTPVVSASGAVVKPEMSPVMNFTVNPGDRRRLAKICEALLKRISDASDVEKIADASLALSYIHDPVATLSIKKGLQDGKLMWQYAIPGLAKIGDEEAIDLMIAIMNRGDIEAGAALARFHLEALLKNAEPDIREKIQKSLG